VRELLRVLGVGEVVTAWSSGDSDMQRSRSSVFLVMYSKQLHRSSSCRVSCSREGRSANLTDLVMVSAMPSVTARMASRSECVYVYVYVYVCVCVCVCVCVSMCVCLCVSLGVVIGN
jgi:hypothetical protein